MSEDDANRADAPGAATKLENRALAGADALREPFEQWITAHWDGVDHAEVAEFASPKSGYSAESVFATLALRRAGREEHQRVVLRLENPEPAIYPVQAPGLDVEIAIQYRTMQALHAHAGVPLAPLLGFEHDTKVLGRPFFVMGHIDGEVPVENPPYPQAGFFAEAAPADRRAMLDRGLAMLAHLHTLDWRAAGLDWLLPPNGDGSLKAQIDLWQAYADRELAGRKHPGLERAWRRLHDEMPETSAPGFSWGDSRPGNIIWRGFEPACLTDFENVAIAPPEVDLGWWLMFDRTMHEATGLPRLPGEPTREEQRAMYTAHAGRDLGDTFYFELFGAARYAAIVVRVMNRMVDRGQLPADQKIWLENPPAQVLAAMLDE